jgi:hypothetical protein
MWRSQLVLRRRCRHVAARASCTRSHTITRCLSQTTGASRNAAGSRHHPRIGRPPEDRSLGRRCTRGRCPWRRRRRAARGPSSPRRRRGPERLRVPAPSASAASGSGIGPARAARGYTGRTSACAGIFTPSPGSGLLLPQRDARSSPRRSRRGDRDGELGRGAGLPMSRPIGRGQQRDLPRRSGRTKGEPVLALGGVGAREAGARRRRNAGDLSASRQAQVVELGIVG